MEIVGPPGGIDNGRGKEKLTGYWKGRGLKKVKSRRGGQDGGREFQEGKGRIENRQDQGNLRTVKIVGKKKRLESRLRRICAVK